MTRSLLSPLLLLAGLLASSGPAQAEVPTYQEALSTYWQAAGRMWMGSNAYRAEGTRFRDGVCEVELKDGVLIPVYSGTPPVSERLVGVVWVGTGRLRMEFPERADAWRFANHMVIRGNEDRARFNAIAHAGAPFETTVDRGLILSADPKIKEMLINLEPVGGGVKIVAGADGTSEEYVITESKGKFLTKLVATNLLPNRRELLVKAGLDPTAMLRQDRLLHEEFGLPGRYLRAVADFHTSEEFRIASQKGKVVGGAGYDQWLTCFRDGLDQTESGYKNMAFSHGIDSDQVRHWERFSGTPYVDPDAGEYQGPPVRMEARKADVTITAQPQGLGNYQKVGVKSTLTLEAVGGHLQYVLMTLPGSSAATGSWELDKLTLADGRTLPFVALREDLAWSKLLGNRTTAETTGGDLAADGTGGDTTGGDSSGGGLSGPETVSANASSTGSNLGATITSQFDQDDIYDREGYTQTEIRREILVVLPEPITEGQTVDIVLDWHARWQFLNISAAGQQLGATTGLMQMTPDLLPAQGGTRWDFTMRTGVPGTGLRVLSVATSGDTVREWTDENLWPWSESQGEGAIAPSITIGRWQELVDPSAMGLPAVRVHLFNNRSAWLSQFPPEARRVVSYLERFLPNYPQDEVQIYQGKRTFVTTMLSRGATRTPYGLVGIQTVANSEVGEAGALRNQNQYLAQTQIASQITNQVWGQLVAPATARDTWIPGALGEAYAAFYIRSAFGNEAYEARMDAVRRLVEETDERQGRTAQAAAVRNRRFLSLTGATELTDVPPKLIQEYGFYVIADMLRLRIGDQPYFFALDRLAQRKKGGRLTTSELQQAFEMASGQDLSEFFDYWVHGGYVPEITVEYRKETSEDGTTRIQGCVVSDIPFGKLEVPVEVIDQDGERSVSALVDVDDGRGVFIVPGRQGEKIEVNADPLALILAYDRKVKEVKETTCEGEGMPRMGYGRATVRAEFIEYDRNIDPRFQGLQDLTGDDGEGDDEAKEIEIPEP